MAVVLGALATGLIATGCGAATRTIVVTPPPKVVTVSPGASKPTTAAPAPSSTAPSTTIPATTAPAAPANPAPATAPTPAPAAPPLTNPSAVVTQFYTAYAEIDATQLDGGIKTYSGTYTARGGVIVSADITETS